jgi:excisionase family DNA binding protein
MELTMQGRNEAVLSAMETSRRLGVTLDYLYRLLYAGRLPGKKLDGVWQIPAEAVEARRAVMEARRQRIAH